MLAKSIIAGTVLSLMAGGIVYFGTDIDTSAIKEKVATKTAELKADAAKISDKVMADSKTTSHSPEENNVKAKDNSVDTSSLKTPSGKVIEAKKPTISYNSKPDTKQLEAAEADAPKNTESPKKKWLDQYLKTNKAKKDVTAEEVTPDSMAKNPDEKSEVAKDMMDRMGLTKKGGSDSDTGTLIVEEKTAELTEDDVKIAEAEGFEKRALETKNIWVEDGETTIETETIDMGDGKTMKIVKKIMTTEDDHKDGKKIRVKIMTDKDGISAEDIKVITLDKHISIDSFANDAKHKVISETVEIVMTEIKKIKQADLRDRAYLSLICFGLDYDDYDLADEALGKIKQVNLRDSGRNHIAIAYAKSGHTEEALAILENIEVEASRDIIRLQVIEALIAPSPSHKEMK